MEKACMKCPLCVQHESTEDAIMTPPLALGSTPGGSQPGLALDAPHLETYILKSFRKRDSQGTQLERKGADPTSSTGEQKL